uniref:PQQ-dependent sugar dehydrogenase n=1 Tax=Desertifilum tharense IPPAS B-1220 TaxID=1781255 RepID=A0ACD5GSI9_9CYAN
MPRILSLTRKLFMSLCLLGLVACNGTPSKPPPPRPPLPQKSTPATPTPVAATNGTPKLVRWWNLGLVPSGSVPVTAQEVVSGLEVPWGIVFLSNTDLLVSERPGRIRLVRNGQLQPQPVATVNVTATGEGGLLGMAVHPDFNNNRQFYIYYTRDRGASPSTASNAGNSPPMVPPPHQTA